MSKEYKYYIKKERINNYIIHITRVLILILFLIIWQLLANYNVINTFITSSPKEITKTILSLYKSNNLLPHIFTTTYETIISFIIGTTLGIIIAIILWYNKFISKVIDPYLTILNSLPKVSLGPILIIWFGANIKSIIIMAILVSIIVTIITTYNAFKETDIIKINLLKSFNATKFQILKYLIIPANYPTIISSLKISISQSLIGVIMGELLVSKKGIGYLIMYGSQVFNINLVITGVVLLAILSYVMYEIIYYIEKKAVQN
jgi:NitT/TauT family transport system permease protein